MTANAVGIQRNQAHRCRAVLGCAQCRQLGRGGGLAHAGGPHQSKHTALFIDSRLRRIGAQIALQHLHQPAHGIRCGQAFGQLFNQRTRKRGRVTGANELVHQAGLNRVLARLAQPGQRVKSFLDQVLHGLHFLHEILRGSSALGLSLRGGAGLLDLNGLGAQRVMPGHTSRCRLGLCGHYGAFVVAVLHALGKGGQRLTSFQR